MVLYNLAFFVLCSVVFMRAKTTNATQASPRNVREGLLRPRAQTVSPKEDTANGSSRFESANKWPFERVDTRGLFSTHVLSNNSRKLSAINKSRKIARHTFVLFAAQQPNRKLEVAIA